MNMISPFQGKPCTFVAGVQKPGEFLPCKLPEVAFAGRSNVGKSTLINALLGRKKLVRVSKNPGCTQQINFFELDHKLSLADLPGYGYARVSHGEKDHWKTLIESYLTSRDCLQKVFLLIDSRHPPKESDYMMAQMLRDLQLPFVTVFTKTDKISKGISPMALAVPSYEVSAKTKEGFEGLYQEFQNLMV